MFGNYPVHKTPAELAASLARARAMIRATPAARPGEAAPLVLGRRPIRVLDRFEFDRIALRPEHLKKIEDVVTHVMASWRRGGPVRLIRIVGHTDNTGQSSYNAQLGRRRALAVRDRLRGRLEQSWPRITRGIRFAVESRGATQPVANNRTQAGRAQNRRVEVFLTEERTAPTARS
jgi:outer membrane protein OmpA-like peptidoglycan-associated protein